MNHWQLSEIRDCITAIVTLINLPLIMLVKPRSHNLVVRREAFFFCKRKSLQGKRKQKESLQGKRKQKESLQGKRKQKESLQGKRKQKESLQGKENRRKAFREKENRRKAFREKKTEGKPSGKLSFRKRNLQERKNRIWKAFREKKLRVENPVKKKKERKIAKVM